jgi:glycosyltransferase involved in cell wall biosynthesis
MAAAKPRIASNVGGIPTVVNDGEDGILVEPEDVQGFANALAKLISSPELRRTMGSAAARRVAADMTPDNYFRAMGRLFDAVAGSSISPVT